MPTAERAAHGFDASDSAGLFVGVQDFDDTKIAPVPFAVDDAVDLAHLFSLELDLIPPEKVTLCLAGKPVKTESKKRLAELRAHRARHCAAGLTELYLELERLRVTSGPRGLVVVALASHGFSEDGAGTIVARDSRFHRLRQTGLSLSALEDDLSLTRAPRRLILVDACRERLTAERSLGSDGASMLSAAFVTAMKRAKGAAVLMATVLGGYAYDDHDRQAGVFTAAIIDGLRGAAPPDLHGLITVGRLANYVDDQVAEWVALHKPPGAAQSPGITRILNQDVGSLPLAISPLGHGELAYYLKRRESALDRLAGELRARRITGSFFDAVSEALPVGGPSPERLELIGVIESLDGSELMVRGLVSRFGLPSRLGDWSGPRRPGDEMTEDVLGMRFRYVPAGTFQMGSPTTEGGREDDETLHEVTLTRDFWMGELEVTQRQWKELMGTWPSRFSHCGADCPVEQVNWYEAVAFANELSGRASLPKCYTLRDCRGSLGGGCPAGAHGSCAGDYECRTVKLMPDCRGYRLPTEAEWERAARAGTSTALYTGPLTIRGQHHGPELARIAWYSGNSGVGYEEGYDCSDWSEKQISDSKSCGPQPVGQKQANDWGLRDMMGNVWEWTSDSAGWQDRVITDTYLAGIKDPQSDRGSNRVIRGCSWESDTHFCRSAFRFLGGLNNRNMSVGFRLGRTP